MIAFLRGSDDADAAQCLAGLEETPNAWRLGGGIDGIRNAAKHYRIPEGKFIVQVLRAFYGGRDVHYGLARVCELHWNLSGIRSGIQMTIDELAARFRDRSASEWNDIAMSMTSDAQVALSGWIEAWNRKQEKLANQHQKRIQHLH